jgi:uncharacterized protein YndB with AHSA1/START domain
MAAPVIHLSTQLPCDPARAYQLFTDPALLKTWLCQDATVEPVVGGAYELFWDPADRTVNSTLGCKVTALEPEQLLAFDWRGPEQFQGLMNACDPLTHVVVAFVPVDAGTAVHLVHSGWREGPAWKAARKWHVQSWALAFAALEELAHGVEG